MMAPPIDAYTIIHLPPASPDWGGVVAQFSLHLTQQEGRAYAAWAGDRLARAAKVSEGMVGLCDGQLCGILLVTVEGNVAEFSLPWLTEPDPPLAAALARQALALIQTHYPALQYLRAERQLVPGQMEIGGLEAAGLRCHWRWRMQLEFAGWEQAWAPLRGYRFEPWNIQYLNQAAEVVFAANEGTIDARLYAPFFGDNPTQCRKGLLSILAGKFGLLHPQATLCAFAGRELVGINLVISEGNGLASVVEISVAPAHQGKGVGRALMLGSLCRLKGERVERVELAVTQVNVRAVGLYESLGFLTVGAFPVCVWPEAALGAQTAS
jgi:ribosomal protein S18 acetylase RimI-like enzyme